MRPHAGPDRDPARRHARPRRISSLALVASPRGGDVDRHSSLASRNPGPHQSRGDCVRGRGAAGFFDPRTPGTGAGGHGRPGPVRPVGRAAAPDDAIWPVDCPVGQSGSASQRPAQGDLEGRHSSTPTRTAVLDPRPDLRCGRRRMDCNLLRHPPSLTPTTHTNPRRSRPDASSVRPHGFPSPSNELVRSLANQGD